MKKIVALVLVACLCLALAMVASAEGSVYYLNFKPEQDAQWQELAKIYTEQTGVPVTVVTAASGNYETTLMSEIEKSDPPTLFQVNGPVGLANWKDYCYDLKDADITKHLTSDSFALKEGDTVYGVAYVIETYGQDRFPGMDICAKSGTAEVGADKSPNAWFTGFLRDEATPYAFIVLVENGGGGSSVAGTVASQVLQAAVEKAY